MFNKNDVDSYDTFIPVETTKGRFFVHNEPGIQKPGIEARRIFGLPQRLDEYALIVLSEENVSYPQLAHQQSIQPIERRTSDVPESTRVWRINPRDDLRAKAVTAKLRGSIREFSPTGSLVRLTYFHPVDLSGENPGQISTTVTKESHYVVENFLIDVHRHFKNGEPPMRRSLKEHLQPVSGVVAEKPCVVQQQTV